MGKTQAGKCSGFSKVGDSGSHRSNSEVLDKGAGEVAVRSTGCSSGEPGLHPTHSMPLVVHNRLDLQLQRTWHPLLATDGTAHMRCTVPHIRKDYI